MSSTPRRSARLAALRAPAAAPQPAEAAPSSAPSSAPSPRRSARLAALPLQPAPAPAKKVLRCHYYLSEKHRWCNRLSCDGTHAFCAEHLPPTPYDEDLEAAHKTLQDYITTNPLLPIKTIDLKNTAELDALGISAVESISWDALTYSRELRAVYMPFWEMAQACKDLNLTNPFLTLYNDISCVSNYYFRIWMDIGSYLHKRRAE